MLGENERLKGMTGQTSRWAPPGCTPCGRRRDAQGGLTSLRQRGQRGRMRRVYLIATLLFLFLALDRAAACPRSCAEPVATCRRSECGALSGSAHHRCVRACQARSTCTAPGAYIRTIAYVVTECRDDAQGFNTVSQKLFVRRGNCDPVPVMELRRSTPIPDPLRICSFSAATRWGPGARWGAPFQRMAVLPNAAGVVFEVSKQNVPPLLRPAAPDPPEEGIFFVRANGKGLRRLGPASRFPQVVFGGNFEGVGGGSGGFAEIERSDYPISPDSRTIALTDYGPGPDGRDAPQIFTLKIRAGHRKQVTHFSASGLVSFRPDYIDDRTILFHTVTFLSREPLELGGPYLTYCIRTNGKLLDEVKYEPVPGSHVIDQFQTGGGATNAVVVGLPEPVLFLGHEVHEVVELFVVDHKRVLQVTHFHRPDTFTGTLRGRHLFFRASANPFDRNPRENCQIFSVNTLGGDLRQLTDFRDEGRPSVGCGLVGGAACAIDAIVLDQVTETVIFGANCDPFETNPYGFQLFSMRPDGSGLRQLTATRGRVIEPDGAVSFQTVGPIAWPARAHPERRQ